MTQSLAHRGPDGEGYVLFAQSEREKPLPIFGPLGASVGTEGPGLHTHRAGLGHRRLAIIDLTPLGHQPMGSEDGRFWITYNGEVYNAPELRQVLQDLGHRFKSSTDTEVVLESYRRWGRACLDRFNGMFAFAVWDQRERTLFCVRDRFGIKPFYYRQDAGRFLFASEIKALLQDGTFQRRPNEGIILDYLSLGRLDHTTDTFFHNIQQLAPGECLWVYQRGQQGRPSVHCERWWTLGEAPAAVSRDHAVVRTRQLIEDSVRLELRADVPVGSCLSGGLDSSTIVCLMSRLLADQAAREPAPAGHGVRPQTFSACHEDPRFDERRFIQAVLDWTGAVNHAVFPNPAQLFESLPDVLWHQEEPFSGTSILAQWAVMRAASEAGIKVLLDGQGGDEVLLGYPGYMGSLLADYVRKGRWARAAIEWSAWRRVHGGLHPTLWAGLVRGILPERSVRWLRSRVLDDGAWLDRTFVRRNSSRDAAGGHRSSRAGSVLDAHVVRALTQDLPALLHYEDRNSMAFSIEARVPFLDHRLVEWLLHLPPEWKIAEGITKRILREAMEGVLPEEVRRRTDKMGFVTPEDEWLKVIWRPQIEATLESDSLRSRPYWRAAVLQEWYGRYRDGRVSIGPTVWRWVNLEWWLRRFCD